MASASSAFSLVRYLPTDQALAALDTWEKVLESTKLKESDWKRVATELGEEDITDFPTIAAVDDQDYQKAVKDIALSPIA